MRVLVVGHQGFDTVSRSTADALRDLGHRVETFSPELASSPWPLNQFRYGREAWSIALRAAIREDRGRIQRRLLDLASSFHPHWVLIVPITVILPRTIDLLKRSGAVVTGWFQDSMVNFGRGDFFEADYDGLFFQDQWVVDRLALWTGDSRIKYLPQCCDPKLHKPVIISDEDVSKYRCDLATYGNLYPYRARVLSTLDDFNLRIYGSRQGWEKTGLLRSHAGFPVYGVEKCKAMRAAKIIINTNHYSEIAGVNKRTYEVAGMGAFQLTDAPGLREMFDDSQVVSYEGAKDLRAKVLYFLSRSHEELGAYSASAQKRAHAEHTYTARMKLLINSVSSLQSLQESPN